jgi:hypothetical protein
MGGRFGLHKISCRYNLICSERNEDLERKFLDLEVFLLGEERERTLVEFDQLFSPSDISLQKLNFTFLLIYRFKGKDSGYDANIRKSQESFAGDEKRAGIEVIRGVRCVTG